MAYGESVFVDKATYEQRVATCMSCPLAYYKSEEDQQMGLVSCNACSTCIVTEKGQFKDKHCPIQKW